MSPFKDLRLSVRALLKSPGFTLAAVAMLALGIGVNATVFTVAHAVLFKGFPAIPNNPRLLYISNGGCCVSYPDFEDIRAQSKSFVGMGMTHGIGKALSDETGFPERLDVTEVTADTFRLTGESPILGRDFTAADQIPGSEPVAILNYGFWQRRYAKDRAVIGRTVRMNGEPTTIIGVMPEGYAFPQIEDAWVPLVKTAQVMNRDSTQTWFAFGLLAPGVRFDSAKAEVEGIIKRLETEYPLSNTRNHLVVQHFSEFFIGPNATALYGSMLGAVGFVLLIACANLANLLLGRAMGRSREISVRIALGAGRWRIVRQLLIESLMLSGIGGFFGWWLAHWGVETYASQMAQKSPWLIIDYAMDSQVLLYLIVISAATGILFGLAPALRLSKLDVNVALKDGGRGSTGGGHNKRLSSILVGGEMALAIMLLAGAGVMVRSFFKIHSANMGVNIANLITGFFVLPDTSYPTPERNLAFYDALKSRIAAEPGVQSVAMAESLPSGSSNQYPYELEGSAAAAPSSRPKIHALRVSAGYFRTMQAKVLSGREFNASDAPTALPTVLVNQLFAEKYFPGEDATGKRVRLFDRDRPGRWLTVVGVVSNIVQNDPNRQRVDPMLYLPYRQDPASGLWVMARTQLPPAQLAAAFRRDVQAIDPDLSVYGPFVMAERLERFWDSRFYGGMFLIFAAIALLLASIGLYTVVANSVRQRTQELGIRMAIGATSRDILRLVFRQGMLPLAIGMAIGLAGSFAVNRVLRAALVGVSPSDPLALIASAGTLILAAALGCLIPAVRAMRVDPVDALRHE